MEPYLCKVFIIVEVKPLMGADLVYAMVIMEVTEEVANERLKELSLQNMEEEHSAFWKYYTEEYEEVEDEIALTLIKEKIGVGLKLAYDCWTRGEWQRDIVSFDLRGVRGIMTADRTWGDSWPALEDLGIISFLRITENDWP